MFQFQIFFTFHGHKQDVFKFLFRHDDIINFRIYVQSASLINSAIANSRKKKGREKCEVLNTSRTERAFPVK